MNILVLDDSDLRHNLFARLFRSYKRAMTAAEAVTALQRSKKFDLVFLDHDLSDSHYAGGYDRNTGLEVAEFITGMKIESRPDLCVVHSMNTVRAPLMVETLQRAGIKAVALVFGSGQFKRFCLDVQKT